jgi:hypothetical protein
VAVKSITLQAPRSPRALKRCVVCAPRLSSISPVLRLVEPVSLVFPVEQSMTVAGFVWYMKRKGIKMDTSESLLLFVYLSVVIQLISLPFLCSTDYSLATSRQSPPFLLRFESKDVAIGSSCWLCDLCSGICSLHFGHTCGQWSFLQGQLQYRPNWWQLCHESSSFSRCLSHCLCERSEMCDRTVSTRISWSLLVVYNSNSMLTVSQISPRQQILLSQEYQEQPQF